MVCAFYNKCLTIFPFAFSQKGQTALHLAASCFSEDLLRRLVEEAADINLQDQVRPSVLGKVFTIFISFHLYCLFYFSSRVSLIPFYFCPRRSCVQSYNQLVWQPLLDTQLSISSRYRNRYLPSSVNENTRCSSIIPSSIPKFAMKNSIVSSCLDVRMVC